MMTDVLSEVGRKAALQIFGEMLRAHRHKGQWTYYAMAEKLGIREDVISGLELGDDVGTELEHEALCDFFGFKLDTFPRLLRNQRELIDQPAAAARTTTAATNIVDLSGYRNKWQKTISHPRD
jgi:transcriptional regulator with XRE-family HTH domain